MYKRQDLTLTQFGFLGTPRRLIVRNSTFGTMQPGPHTYGAAERIEIENCVGYISGPGGHQYKGPSDGGIDQFNMTAGVITVPKSHHALAINWAPPGTYVMLTDANRTNMGHFRVLDVVDNGTSSLIYTDWPHGGWPTGYLTALYVNTHPCPDFTCRTSSQTAPAGTDDGGITYGLSLAPARLPLWSYGRVTFDGNTAPNTEPVFGSFMWGTLVYIKMTPDPLYVGGASTPVRMQIGGTTYQTLNNTGSIQRYEPGIDIKVGGERKAEIISGSASYSGFEANDQSTALASPATAWFSGWFQANMQSDIRPDHGSFLMTVEFLTDQGINNDRFSLAVRYVHEKRSA